MRISFARRIICDPKILGGKPVIRGTRISVAFILELVHSGLSFDDILSEYPHLTRADVEAVIAFAKRAVSQRELVPLSASRSHS